MSKVSDELIAKVCGEVSSKISAVPGWWRAVDLSEAELLELVTWTVQSLRFASTPAKAVRVAIQSAVQQYLDAQKLAHAADETGNAGYTEKGSYFSTLDNLPSFVAAALSALEDAPQQDVVAVPRDVLDRMVPVYEPWMDKHDQDGRAWVSSTRYTLGDIKVLRAALSHPSTPATGSEHE